MEALDEDEMVEPSNGGEGFDEEGVTLRKMLMIEGAAEWGEHKTLVEGMRLMGVRYSVTRFSLIRLTRDQIVRPSSP